MSGGATTATHRDAAAPAPVQILGAATLHPHGEPLAPTAWSGAPARLARMDRLSGLALCAADAALRDAGLDPRAPSFAAERTGVIFASHYGCHATNEEYYRDFLGHRSEGASPRLFAYTLPSSAIGEISIHYRITGPTTTLAGTRTTGLQALLAARRLLAGGCNRVIVVAADTPTPLLSRLVGGVVEESAAALVLAAAGPARRGVIRGLGSAFATDGSAAAAAIRIALAEAGESAGAVRASTGDVDPATLAALGIGGEITPAFDLFGIAAADGDATELRLVTMDDRGGGAAAAVYVGASAS